MSTNIRIHEIVGIKINDGTVNHSGVLPWRL